MSELDKVIVIQQKMLVILICTDLPSDTQEEKEEIARLTNVVSLCGTTNGWVYPSDNQWYEYTITNPELIVGSSNGVPCDKYPDTHKHHILFL